MISKTSIEKKARRKTNPDLAESIRNLKKSEDWKKIANIISSPRRKRIVLNLREIDEISKNGESLLIPGKVLSEGDISKKVRIIAMKFSKSAEEKLLKSKTEFSYISEEIKKNPGAKGLRILMGMENN